MLVHAHPDDEVITCGVTMARYAADGAGVTLVTCTRGEDGEIIVPELAHLAADRDDALGAYRETELAAAMAALGVTDHRFLGAAGHGRRTRVYRDSGMAYGPGGEVTPVAEPRPDAFAVADLDEAAQRLADVVREVRPQVVVTYEPGGGYGHPDHVQAHRVTVRALDLAAADGGAGGPSWTVPKLYWTVVPETLLRAALREPASFGHNPFRGWDPAWPLPSMVVPDDQVTTCVDGSAHLARKAEALRAHATQIVVDGGFFALSDGVGQPLVGLEYYQLARGVPGGPRDAAGRETDLFGGL